MRHVITSRKICDVFYHTLIDNEVSRFLTHGRYMKLIKEKVKKERPYLEDRAFATKRITNISLKFMLKILFD